MLEYIPIEIAMARHTVAGDRVWKPDSPVADPLAMANMDAQMMAEVVLRQYQELEDLRNRKGSDPDGA